MIFSQTQNDKIEWITGSVLNSEQEPVKKAVIFVDSVRTRIKTDKKGKFEIGISSKTSAITAYSENFGITTIPYQGNTEVLLVFSKSDTLFSEELLESKGFTMSNMATLKKPEDYSEYLDMFQLIGNEVPGAVVVGKTIRLRGNATNSYYAGQEPLIIVDGTVVGSIEYIFPRDVASVRVLRGENASIYGVRGANGVIIIKMKQ